jgi:hypothetical protein
MRKDLVLSLHKKIRISRSTIFFEDITVVRPVKKFSHIYENRKIITVCTKKILLRAITPSQNNLIHNLIVYALQVQL